MTIVLVSCVCSRAQVSASSPEAGPAAGAVDQAQEISGTVLSAANDEPLQGATVKLEHTNIITLTDENGDFSLQTDRREGLLEISFLGYVTREVPFSGTNHKLAISLEPDEGVLDEVVVSTGYQEIPKERATGSFVQPDKEIFEKRISTDVLSRLNGITNGLAFNANTGNTINGDLDLNIRGLSTINANDQPLIVVDNFPYAGDLGNINPNDVKSVTILKDAAAASIWGARAGNGVIVITTKKGKKVQALQITVNSNLTVSNKPDLTYNPVFLPADEYIGVEKFLYDQGKYDNDLNDNTSFPAVSPAVEIMDNRHHLTAGDSLRMMDHLKQTDVRNQNGKYFYQNQIVQQYAMNLSGGTQKSAFYFSAGYDRNLHNLKFNRSDRLSLNSTNSFQLLEGLDLMAGIYVTQRTEERDNTLKTVTGSGSIYYPYIEYADGNGNALPITYLNRRSYIEAADANGFLDWSLRPLDELGLSQDKTKITDIRILTGLDYKIWEGLTAGIKYQYQRQNGENKRYHSIETFSARSLINRFSVVDGDMRVTDYNVPLGGYLENSAANMVSHNLRMQLDFDKTLNRHHINAIAGYELHEAEQATLNTMLFGYDDDLATHLPVNGTGYFRTNPSGNASIPMNASTSGTLDRFRSAYALGSYAYGNRYTLTGSARIDGSNYFGVKTNQKSVPLWSIGAKWNLANEKFYHLKMLPILNLTASHGYSGNLDRLTTGVTTFRYLIMARWTNLQYANLANIGNPNLSWERIRQTKIGLEFALKKHVVSGNLEFYFKKGTDLIGSTQMAPSTGVTSYDGNYSQMEGRGIDIQLNSVNTTGKLKWRTSLILNTLNNKITKYDIAVANSRLVTADGLNGKSIVPIVGSPVYSVYSLAFGGLDPKTGDPLGYINGEKSKDYARLNDTALDELIFNGSARPRVVGGLINSFSFNNFSIAINLNYKLDYYFRRLSVNYSSLLGNSVVPHMDFIKRWRQPGDERIATVPSMAYPVNTARENFYRNSSVLVEKGDHIRLQDILVSYNFPKGQIRALPFKYLELFAQANNIGIIWRANKVGLDPDYIPSHNDTYPVPFSLAFGIKVKL